MISLQNYFEQHENKYKKDHPDKTILIYRQDEKICMRVCKSKRNAPKHLPKRGLLDNSHYITRKMPPKTKTQRIRLSSLSRR